MADRLALVLAGPIDGVCVTDLCAALGISRQTYYRLRARYDRDGVDGLVPRSKRPHHSPTEVEVSMQLEILRLRQELPVHRGAAAIVAELERLGHHAPAVSTVHRILVRAGLVTPQPRKRPKTSWTRFTYPVPNGCWQIDATAWHLSDGSEVAITDVIDDHSRAVVAALAGPGPTTDLAIAAISTAAQRWGLPARVLSDNGRCFGGVERRGRFVEFLHGLGIEVTHSRPFHPQTCGKIERFHQTLKQHLAAIAPATDLVELQAQLDGFLDHYNHRRRHGSLHKATPAQAHAATPPAQPRPADPDQVATAPDARVSLHQLRADRHGTLHHGTHDIHMGTHHAGATFTAVRYGQHLLLLEPGTGHPVRALTLNPNQRYHPAPTPPLLSPMS